MSVAIAVLATAPFLARTPAAEAGLELVAAVGTFAAMWWWVRANSAALDRLPWCECASATVTVRVIDGARDDPHRRERVADAMAERRDVAPEAELEVVALPGHHS